MYATLGREDYVLHCCELDPINQTVLQQQGFRIVADNFLHYRPKPHQPCYDLIMMNPPFHDLEYIEHIEHAWSLLNPREGRLVFIAPTNFFWRSDQQCRQFRKLLRTYCEESPFVYPAGRFKESGTPIETVLVSLMKQDQSWRMQPYAGYPNWHCYMLDSHIAQTRELNERQWHIWKQVDRGELPESADHPEWHRTQHVLREFFANAIKHARSDLWIEIELDQVSLHSMEQRFLEYGWLNCQCEHHKQARYQFSEEGQGDHQAIEAALPALCSSATLSAPASRELVPGDYFQKALFSL